MNELTKQFLLESGVKPGMSILDFGCGQGVTTELLADLVGSQGRVTGIDINEKRIHTAREKAKSKNKENIEYVQADVFEYVSTNVSYDMIFGRRVLMYLADPKSTIAALSTMLKDGGKILFQEHDSGALMNGKNTPLHDKVNQWIWKVVEMEGGNIHIGKDLWDIFSHESLKIEDITAETIVQTPNKAVALAPIVHASSNRIIAQNIATEEELDLVNLDNKLNVERINSNGIFVRETIFFVSAQKED